MAARARAIQEVDRRREMEKQVVGGGAKREAAKGRGFRPTFGGGQGEVGM